ncbi:MAG: beta-lactamase family protein [Bryobacterales bacterium]|nr:beta-lactamase family protein [Bryobacterales bacterium]
MLLRLAAFFLSAASCSMAQTPAAGMSEARLERAAEILAAEVRAGKLEAAAVLVARHGKTVLQRAYGHLAGPGSAAVKNDSVFLLASIAKPVTACALMLLVERGLVSLGDPVSHYLPGFAGGERGLVRVRDLLSHTSGLPDMLPENVSLRRAHAPLSAFVGGALRTPLLYKPREGFQYQSMGILLAAEIVERVSGMRLRDFLAKEVFAPLAMTNSALGMKPGWRIEDTVRVWEGADANKPDNLRFGPNSPYWRDMGHPWGGMHSTTADLANLLRAFLDGGMFAGKRWMSPTTVAAMISDQNTAVGKPWGLGWALGRSPVWIYSGELVSPRAFGHSGATGTVAWADPSTGVLCVVLTNRPVSVDDGRTLRMVSNAVNGAVQ